jgi:hypothetical protein
VVNPVLRSIDFAIGMIPARPIGNSPKAKFDQWKYDSLTRSALPSPGVLTSVTQRGTFRVPMLKKPIRRRRIEDPFRLIQTLKWAHNPETLWEQVLPTLIENGLYVGATYGEIGYEYLPDEFGNATPTPVDEKTLLEVLTEEEGLEFVALSTTGPHTEILDNSEYRTKLYKAKSGQVKFTATTDGQFVYPFSGPNYGNVMGSFGFRITMFTVETPPSTPGSSFESQEINGENLTVETMGSFNSETHRAYAVFDGENRGMAAKAGFTGNADVDALPIVKARAEENPRGLLDVTNYVTSTSNPVAIHRTTGSVFRFGLIEDAPQQVNGWVPASTLDATIYASPAHNPNVLFLQAVNPTVEFTIPIPESVGTKWFYFVISAGQQMANQGFGGPTDAGGISESDPRYNPRTLSLTITNL